MKDRLAELQKKKKEKWEKLPFKEKFIYPMIAIIIASIFFSFF